LIQQIQIHIPHPTVHPQCPEFFAIITFVAKTDSAIECEQLHGQLPVCDVFVVASASAEGFYANFVAIK